MTQEIIWVRYYNDALTPYLYYGSNNIINFFVCLKEASHQPYKIGVEKSHTKQKFIYCCQIIRRGDKLWYNDPIDIINENEPDIYDKEDEEDEDDENKRHLKSHLMAREDKYNYEEQQK